MRVAPFALALAGVAFGLSPLSSKADCGLYRYPPNAAVGRHCASTTQAPPPQPVTAICRDRTYSFDQGRAACERNGGVRTWLR